MVNDTQEGRIFFWHKLVKVGSTTDPLKVNHREGDETTDFTVILVAKLFDWWLELNLPIEENHICLNLVDGVLQSLEAFLVLELECLENLVVPVRLPRLAKVSLFALARRVDVPANNIHLVLPDAFLTDKVNVKQLHSYFEDVLMNLPQPPVFIRDGIYLLLDARDVQF